jgi:hypothetical protein
MRIESRAAAALSRNKLFNNSITNYNHKQLQSQAELLPLKRDGTEMRDAGRQRR